MSLKKNVVANYAGQAYTTLIGIVMLPFYLEFLGAEAYGLVGFFTLLHSWLALLTAGVSPTLARQVAHYRGLGELGGRKFREMLRSIELIVLGLSAVTAVAIWLASPWLATQWLTVRTIPLADVAYCIALMGMMVGTRWGVTLYAASLGGMERQIWLNSFGMLFATLRFVAAYVLLKWVTHDPAHYFEFQLVVSMLELAVVSRKFYASQPLGSKKSDPGLVFSWPAMRELLPFAMGISYTSMLWVFMTQSDKLILSHVLTLAEYGYFAVVVLIANGVLQFSAPINQAILPRLTTLLSQGRESDMLTLYRKATQYMVVAVATVSGVLALFPQQVLFALTGNHEAAQWGAPVLTWFALGNGILVVVGMQYVLQYVHGKVRMHVINTTINAAVQVPVLAYVAFNYGAAEVALTWFAIRCITFFIWPAVVHHKFAPGLHWKWLGRDVLFPLVGVILGLSLTQWCVTWVPGLLVGRLQIAGVLVVTGIFVLFLSALFASDVRTMLSRLIGSDRNA
ncbi:lipopolysaccharide biosynthesis protein [Ferrigenium sp. UT5]|uniref:lipopolysaccharide biosynthesis protein n=1 Tax=Ferrigenium sp. UT5 TaxID=3242105 RepID=UPI003551A11B